MTDYITQLTNDKPIRQIAASILLQAMEDWVQIMYNEEESGKPHDQEPAPAVTITKTGKVRKQRKKDVTNCPTYEEIREFLNSDHFKWVCDIVDMPPKLIINKLEGWLDTYRRTGELPNRRYHTLRKEAAKA